MNFSNVKSIQIPEGDVLSLAINGVTVWQKNTLPYDAEIEYIQGSGGPYIDTGIDVPDVTRVAMKMEVATRPAANEYPFGEQGFFGSTAAKGRLMLCVYVNTNADYLAYCDFPNVGRTTYSLSSSVITINKSFAVATAITNTQRILVFRAAKNATRVTPTDVSNGVYRLYYLKLWGANDALIFDGIPVRKGQVGYLYDKVSGNLFGNSGSGTFTLGPDKA